MRTVEIHHFGPDQDTVGGMATVIRLLAQNRVGGDVVVAHPTWSPASGLARARLAGAAALALARVPAGQVVHVHLSERGSFLREGLLLWLADMRGLVTVASIHGASFPPFARCNPKLVSAVLRRARAITCLDQGTLDLVRASAPLARCEIVPNPVLLDHDAPAADATGEAVVFAGEVSLRKGADVLVRAWQQVAERRPSAGCLIVGPAGDFAPQELPRLEVRPAVAPGEMRSILRSARVVALPSRAEAMPMILGEAMGAGRPFVATAVGGIPALAEAGGVLVPVGDAVALADSLEELLEDPRLAREIGERGRQFCAETRSLEVIDRRLRSIYAAAGAGAT